MKISLEELNKVAKLAMLDINEHDKVLYQNDLSNILSLMEQIDNINLADIEPLSNPLEKSLLLHSDLPEDNKYIEKSLDIAPAVENNLYLVPKVIKGS